MSRVKLLALNTRRFTHQKIFLVIFSVSDCVDSRAICGRKGYVNEKFQLDNRELKSRLSGLWFSTSTNCVTAFRLIANHNSDCSMSLNVLVRFLHKYTDSHSCHGSHLLCSLSSPYVIPSEIITLFVAFFKQIKSGSGNVKQADILPNQHTT
jgi:hypothetical protein